MKIIEYKMLGLDNLKEVSCVEESSIKVKFLKLTNEEKKEIVKIIEVLSNDKTIMHIYCCDINGNQVYTTNNHNYWIKRKFDNKNCVIYTESYNGNWKKKEDGDDIKYMFGIYYINNKRAKLKNPPKNITIEDLEII